MLTSSSSSSSSQQSSSSMKDVTMVDCLVSDELNNTSSSYYGPFSGLLELPTHWSSKEKEKSGNLDLNSSNMRVTYKSPKENGDAGLVRANHPIPPACGIYYFEVKVISKGKDGYIGVETVKLFANATGINDSSLESQLDDIKNRQKISDLLLNGDVEKVIAELNRLYPEFLLKRRDILFKLYCQKFIEMIKVAPLEDTLAFGKDLYKFIQESPENEASLNEVFSLIAYQDPYSSPVSYLMQPSRRDPIVSDLNRALLVYCNKPSTPVLEKIVKQVKVVINEVVVHNAAPSAIFMNLNEFIEHDEN
ncbi:hypothetical protein PPL_11319 [Heterostelium album PN500]|uniref:CTLH domain-containing protein n=1 Tax=Heterostelium pallidum (strain ATCC 26659 / Pp 5 / PN500) TaxID=670386 RepID=D3BT27_HETP5|nr:hypothetical protein PPL_11319 [Heterostelium album PN500]EFA75244.1 hypothetical protein PPL_11319 [Heterostelium album PN500]|eukprot:XP_020427378.1 hypothetical protein PPL_11319 [Heterostelium album PN500]